MEDETRGAKRNPVVYNIFCGRQLGYSEHAHCLYRARTSLYSTVNAFPARNLKAGPTKASSLEHESLYGSIFNLEFCPEDDTAYVVSSNKMVLMFDPRIHSPWRKPSHVLKSAHADCVNCVTFLEGNFFATCSDDKSIKIWDRRNMYVHVSHLRGHTNWVKNIEYDPKSNQLFSIAFYDGVRRWDMNKLEVYNDSADGVADNLVIKLQDPVRMRLAPDASKMFISMRKNMCLIIDKFEGLSLHEVGSHIGDLLKNPDSVQLHNSLRGRQQNRPSRHDMSGSKNRQTYRAVMSVDFHPSSEFIALRHIDVRNETLHLELTTVYDVRQEDHAPYLPYNRVKDNYVRYVDEWSSDESLDYIKEISFSKDGRVLASPNEGGVRLFGVDQHCTPLDLYFDKRFYSEEKSLNSFDLNLIHTSLGHLSPVLTCKFAHHDLLLGSGCLRGQVLFHKPQL